jgi:hypothetical protein
VVFCLQTEVVGDTTEMTERVGLGHGFKGFRLFARTTHRTRSWRASR